MLARVPWVVEKAGAINYNLPEQKWFRKRAFFLNYFNNLLIVVNI